MWYCWISGCYGKRVHMQSVGGERYAHKRSFLWLVQSGPYLGTLRPWAQEIPPPYLFVFSYVQLSFQVQLISSTIPAIPLGK